MNASARKMAVVAVGWVLAAVASGQTETRPAAPAGTQPAAATQPATAPLVVPDEQASQAAQRYEEGRRAFFQGRYADAVAPLREAVERDPTRSTYQLLLARALRRDGQAGQAQAVLERILRENPEHVDAGVELAEILSPAEHPDRVIAILEPLLKHRHDYPLYHLLAEAYNHKEDFDRAREHYEEAVRLNPESAADQYELGNIYLLQKRFALARDAYETAGRLGQDSAAYHVKLASVYFNLRNYLGAVATVEVIGGQVGQIRNDRLLIDPVPGRKDTFYASPPRSAIFQIVRAREMGLGEGQVRFLEANTWLNARRYEKADALYRMLEGEVPEADRALFWFYWAQAALGLEDHDAYLERLDRAIELEPEVYEATRADAYVTVADRHLQRGDRERYLEFLGRAVQASPLSAGLHAQFGDALWQTGRRDEAAEQYSLAFELEPDHARRIELLNRIREVRRRPPVESPSAQRTSAPADA